MEKRLANPGASYLQIKAQFGENLAVITRGVSRDTALE